MTVGRPDRPRRHLARRRVRRPTPPTCRCGASSRATPAARCSTSAPAPAASRCDLAARRPRASPRSTSTPRCSPRCASARRAPGSTSTVGATPTRATSTSARAFGARRWCRCRRSSCSRDRARGFLRGAARAPRARAACSRSRSPTTLDGFDGDGGALPPPDVGEADGWRFVSQPMAVRARRRRVADRARAPPVAPDGSRTTRARRDRARRARRRRAGRRGRRRRPARRAGRARSPPTADHVGSEVVVLPWLSARCASARCIPT